MRTRIISTVFIPIALLGIGALLIPGQEIRGRISQGAAPRMALPDFRGAGDAQRFMDVFNGTLWDQLAGSGVLKMVAKSYYPLEVPQQPQDFKPPSMVPPLRRGDPPKAQS